MKRVALSVCVCSVVFGTLGLAEAKERNRCCTTQAVGCAPAAQGVSVGCNSGRMLSYIEALRRAEDANRAEAALAAAKREIAQLKATLETTIAERDTARAAEEEARKIADLERARGTEALQQRDLAINEARAAKDQEAKSVQARDAAVQAQRAAEQARDQATVAMKDAQEQAASLKKSLDDSQAEVKKLQDEQAAKQPADRTKKPELVTEEKDEDAASDEPKEAADKTE